MKYFYKALPSTPWVVDAHMGWYSAGVDGCLLVALESSTSKAVTMNAYGQVAATQSIAWTNLTTLNGSGTSAYGNGSSGPYNQYFRLTSDGTNVKAWASVDGAFYNLVQTYAIATFFTSAPDRFGPGATAANGAVNCTFDWIRVH